MGSWKPTRTRGGAGDEDERKDSRRSVWGMEEVSLGEVKRWMTTTLSKLAHCFMPFATPEIFSRRSIVLPLYKAPSSKKTNYAW